MNLENLNEMFAWCAPVNYQAVLTAFLSAKYGLECDVEVEHRGNSEYAVTARPFFYGTKFKPDEWEVIGTSIADFLANVRCGSESKAALFTEIAVEITTVILRYGIDDK